MNQKDETHRDMQTQELFYDILEEIKDQLDLTKEIDVVVGIPFYNETSSLKYVVEVARESFKSSNLKFMVLCIGDPAGKEALKSLSCLPYPDIKGFLLPSGFNGRGNAIRAIFEIGRSFDADVVLLEADLADAKSDGIKPEWVAALLNPIFQGYDMAVGRFSRHPMENLAGNLLVSPLLRAFYGINLTDPLSGVFGISHELVKEFCIEYDRYDENQRGFGINPWIITTAIRQNRKLCEVRLGRKPESNSFDKKNLVLKEMTRTLFRCLIRDEDLWSETSAVKTPDVFIEIQEGYADINCDYVQVFQAFKEDFYHYYDLLKEVMDISIIKKLESIAEGSLSEINISPNLWAKAVYEIILAFCFKEDINREDLLEATMALYNGVAASAIRAVKITEGINNAVEQGMLPTNPINTFSLFEGYADAFYNKKSHFLKKWKQKAEQTRPFLTPLDYLEFIPGVPIVLPKKLVGIKNREISTGPVFKQLQKRYENEFEAFLTSINTNSRSPSNEVEQKLREFLKGLEETMDKLFPGDLRDQEGTLSVINSIFKVIPYSKILTVKWEILRKLLYEFAPTNLLLRLGFRNMRALLDNIDVRDILTLAAFTEDKDYFDRVYYWLQDNLRHDSFEEVELKPIILNRDQFSSYREFAEISDLNRLTARITVTNLGKGMGGDYPKLRYFTRVAKSIVEAEHFTQIWKAFVRERKEVGRKFINSILGHYGKATFSAHHIFENWHHRELVSKLRKLSETLMSMGMEREANNIFRMAQGYGLSLVLEDGTFIPCSAWTWASYSFKGGEGIPTPLFLRVERDWFNHDLLEEIYKELGYDPEDILKQVFRLISQGRESVDLTETLLKVKPHRQEVVIQPQVPWPKAKELKRYEGNPILNPIENHWWENRYVLNNAAFRLEDKIYLLYRAYGNDEISRIGMAVTDGYRVIERLDCPIFVPGSDEEKKGCEDPRVVIIDDEIFMLYTAYDGVVAQIAAASISIEDFLNRNFDKWKRRGFVFPGLWDKDAILFPEKIDGKYVIYHRIEPSIWVAYSDELVFPWPREGHKIIMGPRSGMMWDSQKIGAGAQPIKTKRGWLLIYHGVDRNMVYRLGTILVDLKDPGKLLYRSPNPILSPETKDEIGEKGKSWVPNVVFTCGAVPLETKEILDDDDEILVYYGAADTNICLATGKVGDLIGLNS